MVASAAVSLLVLISPPPETTAMFVTSAGALEATLTVRVMAGKLAPAARTSVRVQVTVASRQVHPVPAIAVGVSPVGTVSTILTCALTGALPTFDTTIVYCAPTWPWKKLPLCIFTTVKSGNWTIVVTSLAVLTVPVASPPPDTTALLVTLAAAVWETVTVAVIAG